MLKQVIVQPDRNRDDLQPATRDEWRSFEAAIPNHPLVNIPIRFGLASVDRIDAIAISIPELNQAGNQVESGRIVLGARFWLPDQSADDRALTFLHEGIHLRLSDAMQARTIRTAELRQQARVASTVAFERDAADIASFKNQRGMVAFQFHLFPEEVWAELDLRDHYPDWLERRLSALLRMRQDVRAVAGPSLRRIPQPLHAAWIVHELIRVDLVAGLERNERRLATLEALKQKWRRALSLLPMPVGLEDYIDALPRPLERDPTLEARFDRYYDAVLSIAPLTL
jgi:hypothetical protein